MTHQEYDLRQLTDEELELLLQEEEDADFLLEAAEEYANRLEQQGVKIPAPEATWATFAVVHLCNPSAPSAESGAKCVR